MFYLQIFNYSGHFKILKILPAFQAKHQLKTDKNFDVFAQLIEIERDAYRFETLVPLQVA